MALHYRRGRVSSLPAAPVGRQAEEGSRVSGRGEGNQREANSEKNVRRIEAHKPRMFITREEHKSANYRATPGEAAGPFSVGVGRRSSSRPLQTNKTFSVAEPNL